MINLLPPLIKLRIRRWYRARLAIVALLLLFVVILIGTVLLLPSLFLSLVKEYSGTERIMLAQELIPVEKNIEIEKNTRLTNKKISILSQKDANIILLPVINSILEKKPASPTSQGGLAGISITAFLYEKVASSETDKKITPQKILIKGFASNRETLVSFADELRNISLFSDIDLPISNLVKSADIPFIITAFLK